MVITAEEYARFQALLNEKTGILLGDNKQYLVSSRLASFLKQHQLNSFTDLLSALALPSGQSMLQQVIDRMTTNETLWFRDSFPFEYLMSTILPEQKKAGNNRVKIWCAACSSGQEPYSISMAIEEAMAFAGRATLPLNVDILATDISSRVLEQAKKGEYQSLEITRGLTPQRQKQFFDKLDNVYRLKALVKNRIRFSSLNLMQLPYLVGGPFDVIFCRNVLIYFSSELKEQVIRGLCSNLKPGGYLFLGASESMPPTIKEFEMVRCNPGLVYRRL
ncbi:MAG: protein-glutamate O-methyltransferase CheR [Kangiellaceae bacterium]|jgi:chemotaxis protein methyltransferase CheR|nr:protein-glutamate O-methyltransferase CheR [Kangiellaceae bacterium]